MQFSLKVSAIGPLTFVPLFKVDDGPCADLAFK